MNPLTDLDWIKEWVPDVDAQKKRYHVDAGEVDDELIEVFISELLRLAEELRSGRDKSDHETVRAAAHSIKGMGGAVGAPELSVLAETIEHFAKQARSIEASGMINALAKWAHVLNKRIIHE